MSELNVCINVFVCVEQIRFDLTVPPYPHLFPFFLLLWTTNKFF